MDKLKFPDKLKLNEKEFLHLSVFALRCFASAEISYLLASAVGLPYPVWAPISALIVSQERLPETRITLIRRVIGTIFGVFIAVGVHIITSPFGMDVGLQAAISVGICALIAYERPNFRTSLVTGPIILMIAPSSDPMLMVGIYRGSEVIIGGLVGITLHFLADRFLNVLDRKLAARPDPKHAPEE